MCSIKVCPHGNHWKLLIRSHPHAFGHLVHFQHHLGCICLTLAYHMRWMVGKLGFNPYVCSHSISENNAYTGLFQAVFQSHSENIFIFWVNSTLFFLLHITSAGLNCSTELSWDLRGLCHSDKPLQLSSNVQQFLHRRGTYVVQHTILFLPHHHLPERANEPLPTKKKPFISCWMDAKYHMWRWTGHWGLFRSLLCLFFTEELTLFPSVHHSLPTALFIYSVDALLSFFPSFFFIFFSLLIFVFISVILMHAVSNRITVFTISLLIKQVHSSGF